LIEKFSTRDSFAFASASRSFRASSRPSPRNWTAETVDSSPGSSASSSSIVCLIVFAMLSSPMIGQAMR